MSLKIVEMLDIEKIGLTEFQNCGEILFAAKLNEFAMSCKFCGKRFRQLQGFIRHLPIEHTDKMDFDNHFKEVEVYAVEELINQTVASSEPDIGSEFNMPKDDTEWLSEMDLKWLDEGEEPDSRQNDRDRSAAVLYNKEEYMPQTILWDEEVNETGITQTNIGKYQCNVTNNENDLYVTMKEKDDLNVPNISICNALNDCDVSFYFMNKLNSTTCTKDKEVSNLGITLWQQTQNDCSESDTNDTAPKMVITDNDMSNNSIILLDKSEDTVITELDANNSFIAEKSNKAEDYVERSIKNLLQGIKDLDGVDIFINDLECDSHATSDNKIQGNTINTIDIINDIKWPILNTNCRDNWSFNEECTNAELLSNFCQSSNDEIFEKENKTENNRLGNFEAGLQELANALNEDILNGGSITLCEGKNESFEGADNNIHLEQKLTEVAVENTTEPTILQNQALNEDFTKALVDALSRDDLHLLQIELEDENDEPFKDNILDFLESDLEEEKIEESLNSDIMKVLEQELMEKEELPAQKQEMSYIYSISNKFLKKEHLNTNFESELKNNKENETSMYQQTNLKTLNKREQNHATKIILKETNSNIYNQKLLQENLQQISKLPEKPHTSSNITKQRISIQISQNKSSNKENQQNTNLKIQKYRKEKIPFYTSFINTERGNKTPIKTKEMFYKPSLKPLENHEFIRQIATTKREEKILKKQSSITQGKKEDIYLQKTPRKAVCHLKIKKELEKSSETQTKTNKLLKIKKILKTPPNENILVAKEEPKNKPLTAISGEHITAEDNQCEIIETPIKTSTYAKQNFTESSLKNIQKQEVREQIHVEKQEIPLKSKCKVEKTLPIIKNTVKIRQCTASIGIATATEKASYQKIRSNLTNRTPRHSNLDSKSYAVIRSTRKKEVLQRMRNIKRQIFKSIEGSSSLAKYKKEQSSVIKHKKKPTASQVNAQSLINNHTEKGTKLKRPASSLLLEEHESAKCQHISATHKVDEEKIYLELEETKLDLSESCVDFLQRDLKANRLNVESFFNSGVPEDETSAHSKAKNTGADTIKDETALINDLIEQVINENVEEINVQNGNATNEIDNTIEDFNDAKDIELLGKFGLDIIKLPDIEDGIFLEDRDEMHKRAKTFADIYKNWPRIWSTKHCETRTYKEELYNSFERLLNEVYLRFNVKLNIIEIKRLVNLISFWFAKNICSTFIEKRKISDSTNRFLSYFFYIPKTIKRFFYCEFCEEYFNTERKYYTHRLKHTGALYPNVCKTSSRCFKVIKQFKNHESSCTDKSLQVKPTNADTKINPKMKCLVCAEFFETSEILYEHSKKHLKNAYRCAKCQRVFASVIDVRKHMNLCTTAIKRVPRHDTPRQLKIRRSHPKN